ncbi:unnamed protein product [Rhizophagus irregularis]|nr:unnamed protein product [Rhizophagus irregularis]
MPKRLTLDNAKEIARQRGSEECVFQIDILMVIHLCYGIVLKIVWTATFDSIKHQRSWCPYCAGKIHQTLKTAKMIAFNKGGD